MSSKLIYLISLVSVALLSYACRQTQDKAVISDAQITPSNALAHYLQMEDSVFEWEVTDSFSMHNVIAYDVLLTSQKWKKYIWRHQLTILVPQQNDFDGAMLFITGGSNTDEQPNWKSNDDETVQAFGQIAAANNAIVSVLRQVPNQPLFDDLSEDALISYTLHAFQNDGDFSWPLLFPMVKSAVRAMDATQAFATEKLQHQLKHFLVSGASKRGWTTWLTASQDDRVEAIAPMVIDVLNMSASLDYQVEVWKAFSPQIHDYVDLGIAQQVDSGKGDTLTQMIDPYSYRAKLDMPKLIINGTNDPYWPVDAIKNYLDSIPGENHLLYVPDAGHSLGDKKLALQSLNSFFAYTLHKNSFPQISWNISQEGDTMLLQTASQSGKIKAIKLWYSLSTDRDFRDEKWLSKDINLTNSSAIELQESFPDSGFKALYLDYVYESLYGDEFTESTRMYVADDDEVFE